MKRISWKMMGSMLLWPLCFSLLIAPVEASIASDRITGRGVDNQLTLMNRATERHGIMSVLENKIDDQKLLDKAQDKLRSVSDVQLQLMASLSDRITAESNTAGADIAFLLITALIILS